MWKLIFRGFQEVASAAHICMVSNTRSEMDSVSCDLKAHLNLLLLLLCFPEKMREEEHRMEENCRCETYFTPKEIPGKKRSDPFFYLCLRTEKSIFNYTCKVDRGLTYQKCWVQGLEIKYGERLHLLLFGRNKRPYRNKRLESLCLQPALDLEANSVKSDLLGQ